MISSVPPAHRGGPPWTVCLVFDVWEEWGETLYRDERGVEYESVPLPTHEVTDAVPLDARRVGRRSARVSHPFYEGIDGAALAAQPRSHRKRWTDAQWGAYEEHRHLAAVSDDGPVAAAVIVKTRSPPGQDPPGS